MIIKIITINITATIIIPTLELLLFSDGPESVGEFMTVVTLIATVVVAVFITMVVNTTMYKTYTTIIHMAYTD